MITVMPSSPEKRREQARRYYAAHRDEINARARARRAADPDAARRKEREYGARRASRRGQHRDFYLRRKYKMSEEEFETRRAEQEGRCAMCGDPHDLLCVDHDHRCCPGTESCGNCVRGLICVNCNRSLGVIENPVLIAQANVYLARYRV
ncbi:endonuclease VII [Gordonia phage AnarQue]|nr:endonuclease VII [Gordonia phage AnarQue]